MSLEEEAAAVGYGISEAYKKLLLYLEIVENEQDKHSFSAQDIKEYTTKIVSGEIRVN